MYLSASQVYVLDEEKQLVMVMGSKPTTVERDMESITKWVILYQYYMLVFVSMSWIVHIWLLYLLLHTIVCMCVCVSHTCACVRGSERENKKWSRYMWPACFFNCVVHFPNSALYNVTGLDVRVRKIEPHVERDFDEGSA